MRNSLLAAAGIAVAIAVPLPAASQGWLDYELEIAPGFSVERLNSFEVCLAGPSGQLLICPKRNGKFGPLVEYLVTPEFILTRHVGVMRDPRNNTMVTGDWRQAWYFAVDRATNRVVGPYGPVAFAREPFYPGANAHWIRPRNPNFWRPLIGTSIFLGMAALIYLAPLALVGILGTWWYRRRSRARNAVP